MLRKVQVVPTDFSLKPKNPLANYSLAEHARMGNVVDTQLLSVSEKPYASPTMGKLSPENPKGYTEVSLIDTQQAMATGSRVYNVGEVVEDLRRYAKTKPNNKEFQKSMELLIEMVKFSDTQNSRCSFVF